MLYPAWLLIPLGWLALNLVQASFTGLLKDESYYFFFSRIPAWGYWDHPPAIAMLILAGSFLEGEIGVRLFTVVLSVASMILLYRLTDRRDPALFALLFVSFPVFHITGFLAIPDSPLVFATVLFFIAYREFSNHLTLKNAILLGMAMAAMLYSKYLGVLVIGLTVVSNLRLFASGKFWVAVATALALFAPHLLWQYRNDFPSVYYHLVERSHDNSFRWSNIGDYLAGQAALINPLLVIPVIFLAVKFRPANPYERALKFSALGIIVLPLLLMGRGRVEANWTVAGMVPMLLIAYRTFSQRPLLKKYTAWVFGATILLLVMIRGLLVENYFPEPLNSKFRFETEGWPEFSRQVEERAGDRPVVFVSSYQNASIYRFYSGREAFSFNGYLYRGNQYDLSGLERTLHGRDVLVVMNPIDLSAKDITEYSLTVNDSIRLTTGKYHYDLIYPAFRSYNYLPLKYLKNEWEFSAGETIEIPFILGEDGLTADFRNENGMRTTLVSTLYKKGKPLLSKEFDDLTGTFLNGPRSSSCRITLPSTPGDYYLRISVKAGWLPPGINGRIQKIVVK